MRISFVNIPVRDQDRALAFYRDQLGFNVVNDVPMGQGGRWLTVRPPGQAVDLVLFTPPGSEDRIGTFQPLGFTSDDVIKTCEELRARGVEFVQPAVRADWGGMQAIFRDPDGNTFILASP